MSDKPRGKTVGGPLKTGVWAAPFIILGIAFAYGAGSSLWYRFVTSPATDPAVSDTCALDGIDAAQFRGLIRRMTAEGARGGDACVGQDDEVQCFEALMQARIAAYAPQMGHGMDGRMMVLHALMRANKAALISQATVPPQGQHDVRGFGADGHLVSDGRAPLMQRAEIFTYALDTREIGLEAPSLGMNADKRRSLELDEGRTRNPSGTYAIAEVTITLSDPALKYPDDVSTGAVEESVRYVEAAWSHRRSDKNIRPLDRPPLPVESVHELISLCPKRPAWLDVPARPAHPPGTPTADEEHKGFFDFIRKMQ